MGALYGRLQNGNCGRRTEQGPRGDQQDAPEGNEYRGQFGFRGHEQDSGDGCLCGTGGDGDRADGRLGEGQKQGAPRRAATVGAPVEARAQLSHCALQPRAHGFDRHAESARNRAWRQVLEPTQQYRLAIRLVESEHGAHDLSP
ncbi:MAG: hypothetical protein WAT39_00420 [Planctomycetota bacterium]